MRTKLTVLLILVVILIPVVGCDEDNNVFNDPNMTSDPESPTPMLPAPMRKNLFP